MADRRCRKLTRPSDTPLPPPQDLEINIEKIRNQFPRLEQELAAANVERTRVEEDMHRAETDVEDLQTEMQNMHGALQRLKQAQGGGPLSKFGSKLDFVQQEINRRQWVGRKPVGPLGLHVKLRDPSWKAIVEANLGQNMSAYGVTRGEDVKTLRDVLKHCASRYGSCVLRPPCFPNRGLALTAARLSPRLAGTSSSATPTSTSIRPTRPRRPTSTAPTSPTGATRR